MMINFKTTTSLLVFTTILLKTNIFAMEKEADQNKGFVTIRLKNPQLSQEEMNTGRAISAQSDAEKLEELRIKNALIEEQLKQAQLEAQLAEENAKGTQQGATAVVDGQKKKKKKDKWNLEYLMKPRSEERVARNLNKIVKDTEKLFK